MKPDAKLKRDAQFDYKVVWERLKWIGLHRYKIDLDETIQKHTFSRYYISSLYGGGSTVTFPVVESAKAKVHGINHFGFPSLDFNPHAPKNPGDPGLSFESERATKWRRGNLRIFVRLDVSKWLYCGTYQFIPSESLTAAEFCDQPPKVSNCNEGRWFNS